METNCAGCEKEDRPAVSGRNTHDKFVTFDAVNRGTKKSTAGGIGTQSKLTLLPKNDTLGDANDCMTGETSRTDTEISLSVITRSVIAG